MSTVSREKSASSTRSYYRNYEQKQRLMNSDTLSNSADKDAALSSNATRGLRSAARLSSAYRLADPLSTDSYYDSDYLRLHKPLSSWGTRWTLSHEELLRQLNEERARIKELEMIRARQTTTIGELESTVRNMRINGYDDTTSMAEENSRLRMDVNRLEDELIQLRAGRSIPTLDYTNRLQNAEERVRVLEQQLLDDARQWQIERSHMLNRMAPVERRWPSSYPAVLPPVYQPRYVLYRD